MISTEWHIEVILGSHNWDFKYHRTDGKNTCLHINYLYVLLKIYTLFVISENYRNIVVFLIVWTIRPTQ